MHKYMNTIHRYTHTLHYTYIQTLYTYIHTYTIHDLSHLMSHYNDQNNNKLYIIYIISNSCKTN